MGLLTKREVKMAGYRPSSFFAGLCQSQRASARFGSSCLLTGLGIKWYKSANQKTGILTVYES